MKAVEEEELMKAHLSGNKNGVIVFDSKISANNENPEARYHSGGRRQ